MVRPILMYHRRYGDLAVLRKTGRTTDRGYVEWLCRCRCGEEVAVSGDRLRSGQKLTCGVNGHYPSRTLPPGFRKQYAEEYKIWINIKARCFNRNHDRYPDYGGRGITLCELWQRSFEQFMMDLGPRPSRNHSLDRIDVNKNYEPGNCRWAPRQLQSQNQRQTLFVEYEGALVRLAELISKKSPLDYILVLARIRWGWTLEDALFIPPNTKAVANRTRGNPPVQLHQPNMPPGRTT